MLNFSRGVLFKRLCGQEAYFSRILKKDVNFWPAERYYYRKIKM